MPFERQGSALPPKKRTKLISVPVDGVNLRVVLLSAAYGSVPDTDRSGELDPIKLPLTITPHCLKFVRQDKRGRSRLFC